jgi:hypothetical protein
MTNNIKYEYNFLDDNDFSDTSDCECTRTNVQEQSVLTSKGYLFWFTNDTMFHNNQVYLSASKVPVDKINRINQKYNLKEKYYVLKQVRVNNMLDSVLGLMEFLSEFTVDYSNCFVIPKLSLTFLNRIIYEYAKENVKYFIIFE